LQSRAVFYILTPVSSLPGGLRFRPGQAAFGNSSFASGSMDSPMIRLIRRVRKSLATKLILIAGVILMLTISAWSYFSIAYQKDYLQQKFVAQTERLGNTI
jgi:hypothetical protein